MQRAVLYSIYISSCDNVYYKVKRIISPDHENAVPNPIQYAFPDPWCLAALDRGIQATRAVRSYLVESPEGDLLWVEKPNIEIKFVVYALVWFSRNPRWERVIVVS